jgi:hypothetical protein
MLYEQMLYLQESLQASKSLNFQTKPTISKNIGTKVVQTKVQTFEQNVAFKNSRTKVVQTNVRTFEQNLSFKKHYNQSCSNKGSNIRTKPPFQKQ